MIHDLLFPVVISHFVAPENHAHFYIHLPPSTSIMFVNIGMFCLFNIFFIDSQPSTTSLCKFDQFCKNPTCPFVHSSPAKCTFMIISNIMECRASCRLLNK